MLALLCFRTIYLFWSYGNSMKICLNSHGTTRVLFSYALSARILYYFRCVPVVSRWCSWYIKKTTEWVSMQSENFQMFYSTGKNYSFLSWRPVFSSNKEIRDGFWLTGFLFLLLHLSGLVSHQSWPVCCICCVPFFPSFFFWGLKAPEKKLSTEKTETNAWSHGLTTGSHCTSMNNLLLFCVVLYTFFNFSRLFGSLELQHPNCSPPLNATRWEHTVCLLWDWIHTPGKEWTKVLHWNCCSTSHLAIWPH